MLKWEPDKMKVLFSVGFLYAVLIPNSFADSARFIGHPITKASCEADNCFHQELLESDQVKHELIISNAQDQYFWTSREGKELKRAESGSFIYFINPGGSGYIKVSLLNGQCLYLEHLTLGLQTITYWGTCEGL